MTAEVPWTAEDTQRAIAFWEEYQKTRGHVRRSKTIKLSPEAQLAFWKALHAPVKLTNKQRRLGKLMRGEA